MKSLWLLYLLNTLLWERRIGVLDELHELCLEPAPGDRCVCQCTCHVVTVELVACIGGVAHAVEALAARVLWTGRNEGTGSIRLTGWLDPYIRINARNRIRSGTCTDAGAILITPVTFVNALIDAGFHDECTQGR